MARRGGTRPRAGGRLVQCRDLIGLRRYALREKSIELGVQVAWTEDDRAGGDLLPGEPPKPMNVLRREVDRRYRGEVWRTNEVPVSDWPSQSFMGKIRVNRHRAPWMTAWCSPSSSTSSRCNASSGVSPGSTPPPGQAQNPSTWSSPSQWKCTRSTLSALSRTSARAAWRMRNATARLDHRARLRFWTHIDLR